MKKSELEKIIKEELAKMKMAKPMKEQEETTLSPETEKLVQDAVAALKGSNEGQIDENLMSGDTAELVSQVIAGVYGAVVALGVGNLIKLAIQTPKDELKDAFAKIAQEINAKQGGGGGSKKGGGIGGI